MKKIKKKIENFYYQASPYYLSCRDIIAGLVVTFFFFFLYLYTCSHSVNIAGDSPEMIAVSNSLGIPHPPGYPLYTLLGFMFTRLPFGSIAFRVNLSSVIYHSICLFIFFVVSIKLTHNLFASVIATTVLGFSPLFWFYSLVAEVFSLNNLFIVTLLLLAIHARDKWLERKYKSSFFSVIALAFFFGLSLCNHHTIIFLFPTLCIFAAIPILEMFKKPKYIASCLGAFIAGLLPYLYIPLRASSNPFVNFQDPSTFAKFINFVSRRYYGTFKLWKGPSAEHRLDVVFEFLKCLTEQVYVIGLVLGFAGLVYLAIKKKGDFYPLIFGFLLSGVLFSLLANVKIETVFHASTLERFFLFPTIIYVLFIAFGLARIIEWIHRKAFKLPIQADIANGIILVSALLLSLPFIMQASTVSEIVNLKYDKAGETELRNLLASVEEGSVVFLRGDMHAQLALYYETCIRDRKKVYFLIEPFLSNDWYAETIRKWYPELVYPDLGTLWSESKGIRDNFMENFITYIIEHNKNVPGFYININAEYLNKKYNLFPWGIVYKIQPKQANFDYKSYLKTQFDYWKGYDHQGLYHGLYIGNRRERELEPYVSLILRDLGQIVKENLSEELAIRIYKISYETYPYYDVVDELGDLYAKLGKKDEALYFYYQIWNGSNFDVLLKMEDVVEARMNDE